MAMVGNMMANEALVRDLDSGDHHRQSVTVERANGETEEIETRFYQDSHDVPLSEIFYYARLQREREDAYVHTGEEEGASPWVRTFKKLSNRKVADVAPEAIDDPTGKHAPAAAMVGENDEKHGSSLTDEKAAHIIVDDDSAMHRNASAALRTASWGSIFYLITTDILGPYSAPYLFAQVGYGSGVTVFIFFGIFAGYGGFLIWHMFLGLDSLQYPMRTFGDLCGRVLGRPARHMSNFLQAAQLITNVAIITLGNGQGLSQVSKFKLCFVVCNVLWMASGMILGQVRTLKKFGWLATLAIYMNLLVIIITMGVVCHQVPNYGANGESQYQNPDGSWMPVQTFLEVSQPFEGKLVGILQVVFSYGGAMVFCEFMSEMRRPFDFWKAMLWGQLFIFVVYMTFGLVVYSQQGQYVVNPANQGISGYVMQTITNMISLTAGIIAAALYGNIGIKLLYNNILVTFFKAPELHTKGGKMLWIPVVIAFWAGAFAIGSAIPAFSALSGIVAAFAILQFSYTFPIGLSVVYQIKRDAVMLPGGEGEFDPANPNPTKDTWRQMSRWKRAIGHWWYIKAFNFIIFLACLAMTGLSAYSSIEAIIEAFSSGAITAFTCCSPVNPAGC
ncbi:hypothetical protein E5Q_01887 [Mixia osmundae IAM 14324]|uniref:Amino acid transporter transmembrane domain-containing protein n=1 Tax=Mixia osmundae (strain CBS 9802 / IAM 14324 / JCM 22182 / KY 12970) TaxID=764103 RepID=G7DXC1_MIXOS|nr:hypothetical protein E5Q_01887 [Mixia osmundae IAM 14324]